MCEYLALWFDKSYIFTLQVRLGWHDAGTYNKNIEEWPLRGGANGSLRFEAELKHAANAGTASITFTCFVA